jgi:protein-tyrosine phosphatase
MRMKAAMDLGFTDVHCHLLPGIDDGPRDWQGTLALARAAVSQGIDTIIATPHQLGRYEGNTLERVLELVAEAQWRIKRENIPLTVLPGADVRVREDLVHLLWDRQIVTLADNNVYLLLELPHDQALPLGKLIYELQERGIVCVISHPERNAEVMTRDMVRSWVQQGCLVQITAGSLLGEFGAAAKKASWRLLGQGLVHLVATDAHDTHKRPPRLRTAYQQLCRWCGTETARQLCIVNPRAVARGETIDVPLPRSSPGAGMGSWLGAWISAKRNGAN